MVSTWCFHCWGQGSIPGRELRSPKPGGVAKKKKINFQRRWAGRGNRKKVVTRQNLPNNVLGM